MKSKRILHLFLAFPIFFVACEGGSSDSKSNSSNASGTVTINVTDAKPALPLEIEHVLISFDEVSVHRSGGGWTYLSLSQDPTIDLLQFTDGSTTELVPPVQLVEGKYTQIRIGVTEAIISINGDDYSVEIPSNYLKTETSVDFVVKGGGALDLTIDFDLSQSIVVTGEKTYSLKPVFHVNKTQEAATIQVKISNSSFADSAPATVIVFWDKDGDGIGDEEYTRLIVEKEPSDPTEFIIFWLVPQKNYEVLIDLDGQFETIDDTSFNYIESVDQSELTAGSIFELNEGDPI